MKSFVLPSSYTLGLVVFDLAGTTLQVSNYVTDAFRRAFIEVGIILKDEEINLIRGRSKRGAISLLLQIYNRSQATSMTESLHETFQKLLMQAVSKKGVEAILGAEEVFQWLKDRDVLIALNTGFDRNIASLMLDSVGWSGIADAVVCGDDVSNGRPAPDLIIEAMKQTGYTETSGVIAVGDTRYDMQAAHSANVLAVGVLSGANNAEQLRAYPHYAIIPSVADLREVLNQKTIKGSQLTSNEYESKR